MDDLITFMIEVDGDENIAHLWDALNDYLSSHGVKRIFYRHVPLISSEVFDSNHLYTNNLPLCIRERYIDEKLYESDILQMMAFSQSQTYSWFNDEILKTAKDSQIKFVKLLIECMSDEILLIPAFGRSNRSGYFCLSFNSLGAEISELDLRRCQIACNYAHVKYAQFLTYEKAQADSLSNRELEIIRWVARGKSNSVIGDIMGISRHTVDSYLRRIFIKMEATDRTTAALKALGLGLIIS